MIFSVYLYKCHNYDITLLPKFFSITEKDDMHPRKYDISVEIPY